MSFAARIEVLATGEVSVKFSNESGAWHKVFSSVPLAAKEAERLGVFDSTARRHFEQVMDAAELGYADPNVDVRVNQLLSRGFTEV